MLKVDKCNAKVQVNSFVFCIVLVASAQRFLIRILKLV